MLIEVGSFCRSNAVYRRTARKCAFSADWRGNFRPEQIVARGGRTRTPHISQNTHENQIVQRLGRAA